MNSNVFHRLDKKTKQNKTNKSKAKVTNKTKKKEEKLGFWNRIENEIHSSYVRLEFGLSLSLSFFPWYFSGRPCFYFPHRYKSFSALTSARMSTTAIFQTFVYQRKVVIIISLELDYQHWHISELDLNSSNIQSKNYKKKTKNKKKTIFLARKHHPSKPEMKHKDLSHKPFISYDCDRTLLKSGFFNGI